MQKLKLLMATFMQQQNMVLKVRGLILKKFQKMIQLKHLYSILP